MVILSGRRWSKIWHESFQVDKLDSIGELRLAKNSHETIDLAIAKFVTFIALDANTVASRDEIISCHNFHIRLPLKLGQIVDDIFTTKLFLHCCFEAFKTMSNLVEYLLGDI